MLAASFLEDLSQAWGATASLAARRRLRRSVVSVKMAGIMGNSAVYIPAKYW